MNLPLSGDETHGIDDQEQSQKKQPGEVGDATFWPEKEVMRAIEEFGWN